MHLLLYFPGEWCLTNSPFAIVSLDCLYVCLVLQSGNKLIAAIYYIYCSKLSRRWRLYGTCVVCLICFLFLSVVKENFGNSICSGESASEGSGEGSDADSQDVSLHNVLLDSTVN